MFFQRTLFWSGLEEPLKLRHRGTPPSLRRGKLSNICNVCACISLKRKYSKLLNSVLNLGKLQQDAGKLFGAHLHKLILVVRFWCRCYFVSNKKESQLSQLRLQRPLFPHTCQHLTSLFLDVLASLFVFCLFVFCFIMIVYLGGWIEIFQFSWKHWHSGSTFWQKHFPLVAPAWTVADVWHCKSFIDFRFRGVLCYEGYVEKVSIQDIYSLDKWSKWLNFSFPQRAEQILTIFLCLFCVSEWTNTCTWYMNAYKTFLSKFL